jgi:isobutyryl-CoA mutase
MSEAAAIGRSAASPETLTPPRFVTAASLFDGHDASINIMRRILQSVGAEVIHLGHNRSVEEVVMAAIQEDVDGIAVSSYQGGHVEYFKYMVDMLRERGGGHICVFGGGGGVIIADEIQELHDYGVARIYSPEDGQKLGLQGMIDHMVATLDSKRASRSEADLEAVAGGDRLALSHAITALEVGVASGTVLARLEGAAGVAGGPPIIGITGTGGAGKSSLTDEIVRRFRLDHEDRLKIAVLAVDPSRRKTGGALLGDRIRMNAIDHPNVFVRSIATRSSGAEVPQALGPILSLMRLASFDVIIVETSGIGQGDAAIVPFVDVPMYVMTPEFGAASQLEKIDMLDFAELVAINKFDRKGAQDALRDVRKQVVRNTEAFGSSPEDMPVFGTIASRFNDDGVTALYHGLIDILENRGIDGIRGGRLARPETKESSRANAIIPPSRVRYLAEISEAVRGWHADTERQANLARQAWQLRATVEMLEEGAGQADELKAMADKREAQLSPESRQLLAEWPARVEAYSGKEYVVKIRDREIRTSLRYETLSGSSVAKVSLPKYSDHGDILSWLRSENLPGYFPFTAGVFPFKREGEDPSRMFAGEGDASRTNRRFHYLSEHSEAKRLSTAFDSVTLYGFDPHHRPDIYGKVGNSGVSIATLNDMKTLYAGFDLCDPRTSVSMTINGPAPTILAMFLNTAIDQQVVAFKAEKGRAPGEMEEDELRQHALRNVRGTVQADILKEDQGQNTCIFSTEFSLKVMGDIQEFFVANEVRNFYSVSISGYHIAEAGANPLTQLALTLANGFTYVETYLARGMSVDEFAPNFSFFFSNGMDPEYTVMGRVARRIWATSMRERYGANERSQKLKYHIQTSGRSLHAQEIDFNDIRTTLQALIATYDNCNSLHTNAYDEAITTPTEESVRRALAIQLIINREWGLARNENPNQGAFIIEELTDLVEECVLQEFERISERGGVLGAMETGYQRGRIQDESMYYEHQKHDGSLPIIGVNTYLNPHPPQGPAVIELARSTTEEKEGQIERLTTFQRGNTQAGEDVLRRLEEVSMVNGNVFEVLMDAVKHCSLGQITDTLFNAGGKYRRNM